MENTQQLLLAIELLAGKKRSTTSFIADVVDWSEQKCQQAVDNFPEAYRKRTGKIMPDYTGLVLFCELVKFIKTISLPQRAHQQLLLMAQKKVLFYHNTQYDQKRS